VAVVQISRIQIRRGRKLSGSGMPQLASGEMGWAIDTQELYIGNGAVSEGAPAVGNTKIITDKDNIFDLAGQYAYKPTDNLWGVITPVERTLQERLDEIVSVFSFGATGDGSDQTDEIQDALDSLYLNGDVYNRVILWFPPGEYFVSDTIKLPPYAVIRGSGKDKTIFRSNSCHVFETVNSSSTPGNYNAVPSTSLYSVNGNQCRYLDITDISVELEGYYAAFLLNECANSKFSNIKISGDYISGSSAVGIHNLQGFVFSANGLANCINNCFSKIEVDGVYYSVYTQYDIKDNVWQDSLFMNNYMAFALGVDGVFAPGNPAQETGPTFNTIQNSKFDMIDKEAINITNGEYNKSVNNKFYNVGNDGGVASLAVTSIIKLGSYTNTSDLDYFERTGDLVLNSTLDLYYNREYVPEIEGRVFYQNRYVYTTAIGQQFSNFKLLKFPAVGDGSIIIDYVYTETALDILREGSLELVCNYSDGSVLVNDNYSFIGNVIYSSSLQFTAALVNNGVIKAGLDTIELNCTNSMPVAQDQFLFSIRTKA